MNLKKLSVKNFIGDLPRIINESLTAIENAFGKIYNEDTNTIGNNSSNVECKSVTARGNENGNGIVSYGDVKIILNNETISLVDLYNRVKELEYNDTQAVMGKSLLAKKKLQ